MKSGTGNRLKNVKGFTLAETLLAVLILLLVSVIVATGMPAARNAYEKVIIGANAKTMLSTAVTELHDTFATAWKVEVPKDSSGNPVQKTLTYFNAGIGAKSMISLDSTGSFPSIQIQDYMSLSDDLIHSSGYEGGTAYHLVPDKNISLYVTYEDILYANGVVTVEGLKVCRQTDGYALATLEDASGNPLNLTIRVISDSATSS